MGNESNQEKNHITRRIAKEHNEVFSKDFNSKKDTTRQKE